ncbi:uridine diphosphate glucose pyrophosphatase NUDT14-like isoform X2 [Gigantopelta aegis]|nr:uridine diphosphate glucose pyrophosphatase NUDT14-like isoform X2 [Gigantopelta aegis]XP_041351540.1 uridine diphosphate glucose pyrophosphatase NUDT14-like isoform X2 [Gigantopelta aegis]XP_041351541.1 uridine diphosphate glucose pyrophosphatase NUDT14-like isoform X2 [Gigantopelta aegis]
MEKIEDVTVGPCPTSKYLKPLRMHYKQNGKPKIWDLLKVHDSVVIVVFNSTRNVLVFVKQFRPVIYVASAETFSENGVDKIDTTKYPSSLGMTIELCAGIIDKDHTPQMIAQDELLEECGYKVPLDKIEKVTSYRSGVGTAGALQTLFYVEVTDAMRVSSGGGVAEEGEMIDVVEIPVSEGRSLIMNESVVKPIHLMFALMWFYENKWKQ